ncbi:hypothetical protein DERF_004220 [Dermatophagoides farinae]|uniref:Uncharacterized protein n=1 Tax=Dermatophagoides farinae TaxID=6954 RepID=A0A922I4C2_DERFA|nr:hypothetical protein DERF_004220 [Dermatophagoides farinae]
MSLKKEQHIYMCRVLPKLRPLAFAPLFVPYCKLITPSPARNCSSVKLRLFSSAGFGPKNGPGHSGCK